MNRLLLILWSLGPMLWQLYTSFRPNAALTGNPLQEAGRSSITSRCWRATLRFGATCSIAAWWV